MVHKLKKNKWLIIAGFSGVFLLLLFGIAFIVNDKEVIEESWEETVNLNENQDIEAQDKRTNSEESMMVDVKGAVKNPGIYQVESISRVWDVLMSAGGMNENADTRNVNFAQKIADQMIIYVPIIGEELQESEMIQINQNAQGITSKININVAKENELQQINGIGLKKAQEIIRYREENGQFQSVEDLKNISGIGEKTIDKIRDLVTVT